MKKHRCTKHILRAGKYGRCRRSCQGVGRHCRQHAIRELARQLQVKFPDLQLRHIRGI